MTVREFQQLIERLYFEKDSGRGMEATFMWLVEEVGELSRALRRESPEELAGEFADCAAWLSTLASIAGVDLEQAVIDKYGEGCPKCKRVPCSCEGP
ncbi:MAG: MazG nucleotide pyrophosphohydrolase domain-containing protein [Armatimonadota bacterium]